MIIVCLLAVVMVNAGNRMSPSEIYYSDEYECWVLEMDIDNPDEMINGFQCDIAIPEQFSFDVGMYMFTRRAQELKMGKYVDTHTCTSFVRPNGCLRVLVYSSTNAMIQGNSGAVLVQALKDVTPLKNIPHTSRFKVNMTNIVMARLVNGVTIETPDYPEAVVGDSTLQCYNCMDDRAFVIGNVTGIELEDINENLSTNDRLVTVDVTKCTNATLGTFDVLNGNTIIMAATETQVSNEYNVFWREDEEWRCNNFRLFDDGLTMCLPFDARVRHFSYDRSYAGGVWNTVCLPVELTTEQYKMLKDRNVTVRRLARFDAVYAALYFEDADDFAGNVPYIIKPATDGTVFEGFEDVMVVKSERIGVTDNNLTMLGNYDYTVIGSTAETSRYGYEEGSGEFCKLGQNCILKPFRCVMELPVALSQDKPRLAIATENMNPDGIDSVFSDSDKTDDRGGKADVYTVDGHRVMCDGLTECIKNHLPAGIYIVNGKKMVIR